MGLGSPAKEVIHILNNRGMLISFPLLFRFSKFLFSFCVCVCVWVGGYGCSSAFPVEPLLRRPLPV